MERVREATLLVFGVVIILFGVDVQTQDWPQWRGPDGRRVAVETRLPTTWTPSKISWKTRLPGQGVSSPIVSGELVVLTSQLGRGPLRPGGHPTLIRGRGSLREEQPLNSTRVFSDGDDVSFLVTAFNRLDGSVEWQYEVAAKGELPDVHQKSNLANASPASDGKHVYAWFATGQLIAVDLSGNLVWDRDLARDYGSFKIVWGHSSSPIVYKDFLILQCDHESGAYLLALDRQTGEERWKVNRGIGLRSFSTPIVATGPLGDELVVNSSERLDGYNPQTGEWLWHAGDSNRFPVPAATHDGEGMLYTSRGHRAGPYMAIRLGGRGDVGKTHVAWKTATGAPYVSSILYYDGIIYMANGGGIVTAVEAGNGRQLWQERLGGVYSASPLAGDGKVYFFSESGETLVVKAGRELELLARNDLGERIVSSPAVSDGHIFIRTDESLISVGMVP